MEWKIHFFVSNKQTINKRLSLEYGMRYSSFLFLGKGKILHF